MSTLWLFIKSQQLVTHSFQSEGRNFMEPVKGKLPNVIGSFSHESCEQIDSQVKQNWVSDAVHVYQVPGVRQQAGFIICYGPQCAIAQPWNCTSAANIHFAVTKSALCLLPEGEASAPSTLILFSGGKTIKKKKEKGKKRRGSFNKLPVALLLCIYWILHHWCSPATTSIWFVYTVFF